MSIQEWAAIAEIVGAVAVVASLVYLAVQIRQNTHGLAMSLKSTELAAFERNVEAGNRIREIFIAVFNRIRHGHHFTSEGGDYFLSHYHHCDHIGHFEFADVSVKLWIDSIDEIRATLFYHYNTGVHDRCVCRCSDDYVSRDCDLWHHRLPAYDS